MARSVPLDFSKIWQCEDGNGWTFAVFFEPTGASRLGLELSSVDAERPAAAGHGFEADTGADSVKLELRYYFGS